MNILLTNDDGYLAPGINALKSILEKFGNVYVVAPHFAQSGKSAGITFVYNLVIHQIDEKIWTVEGTPVDCVIVASMVIKEPIDLVVSGCNNGFNQSYDVLYSGTCGACYQSLMFKMKALALSVQKFETPWQINEEVEKVIKYVLDNSLLSEKYFLNINMQSKEYEKPKGYKITKLYPRSSHFNKEELVKAKSLYKVKDVSEYGNNCLYDYCATKNGYVSITPLSLPSSDEEAFNKLTEIAKNK